MEYFTHLFVSLSAAVRKCLSLINEKRPIQQTFEAEHAAHLIVPSLNEPLDKNLHH